MGIRRRIVRFRFGRAQHYEILAIHLQPQLEPQLEWTSHDSVDTQHVPTDASSKATGLT